MGNVQESTITTAEMGNFIIEQLKKSHNDIYDSLDYFEPKGAFLESESKIIDLYSQFTFKINDGGSEGLYGALFATDYETGEKPVTVRVASVKTLDITITGYQVMGNIGGLSVFYAENYRKIMKENEANGTN